VIPKTDDRVAVGFQDPCAVGIPFRIVLPAVQLDHQPRLLAGEIRDGTARRLLALELGAFDLPVAEILPEPVLGIGAIDAKSSGDWGQALLRHA
jgi:hypothetical protein